MEHKLKTEAFYETGMEGISWSLYDERKTGYDGLVTLDNGDWLHIPGKFKGYIKKVGGCITNWRQDGWDKNEWAELFFEEQDCFYREGHRETIYIKEFNYFEIFKY